MSLRCGFPVCKVGMEAHRVTMRTEREHASCLPLEELAFTGRTGQTLMPCQDLFPARVPGDVKPDGGISLAKSSCGGWICLKF